MTQLRESKRLLSGVSTRPGGALKLKTLSHSPAQLKYILGERIPERTVQDNNECEKLKVTSSKMNIPHLLVRHGKKKLTRIFFDFHFFFGKCGRYKKKE